MQHMAYSLRLLRCSVLAAAVVCGNSDRACSEQAAEPAPESEAAGSTRPSSSEPGEDIGKLMLKLDAEIADARLTSPIGDSAMDTLGQILALVSRATPSELEAIDQLPSRFDQRASDARARGDNAAADRFVAFRKALTLGGGQLARAEGKARPQSGLAAFSAGQATRTDLSAEAEDDKSNPQTQRSDGSGAPKSFGEDSASRLSSSASQTPPSSASPDAALQRAIDGAELAHASQPHTPTSVASIATITALSKRGEEKLSQGDLVAARLLFLRAAEASSGAGAAGVAKTYDPLFLQELGSGHTQADAALAAEWYRKAIALGDQASVAALSRLERRKLESSGPPREQAASHP